VIAYIDQAEVFDSVSHGKLMTKIQAHGITGTGNLKYWIKYFYVIAFSARE